MIDPAVVLQSAVDAGATGAVVLALVRSLGLLRTDSTPKVDLVAERRARNRARMRAQRAQDRARQQETHQPPAQVAVHTACTHAPSDQSTKKIDQIIINDLSVDARESPQVPVVAEQVTRLCGGKRPSHLDEEIARHLAAGIPPETILATVRVVNQRKRGPPPSSARYYAKEIMQAHAQGQLPFPAASGVSDFAARWAANTAKQLAEREAMELRSG